MRFVIVTGMSGAGKSTVLKMLEDAGYFCVDNLPVPLLPKFAELVSGQEDGTMTKAALGIDIRSGEGLVTVNKVLDNISDFSSHYEILFLDCNDSVLIKRYKETRRQHPLSMGGRVEDGIRNERKKMKFLKDRADYIIDTSQMLVRDLKGEVDKIFVKDEPYQNFFMTVLSFGFKYGIPVDADLVFDVRFLPNPYYVENLRKKTGNEKEVQDYVMNCEEAGEFLNKIEDLLVFLVPLYIKEGKNQLVIAVGCTGGKHRSVTVANGIYERLKGLGYSAKAEHRDIEKDAARNK
ncbi:RNase adapter RapZ [Frisingicoccus sp.]|uniref:RNase adapter RapZ n=1 Tax=Frisingicoccus sp. TaxID=1918627 RepID=UPI002634243B|nr:RNase adapter RapZ [Frisingicoccus sp.]MDD6232193.1 RNase adapter RapZ [Frisingicoccus sp.]MDY4835112.1 RNase adapter RapZ [Frisingicoccus sp.]MDY4923173.1 RNase adapter RapZ [Frisingicoccus sp.]